MKNQVALMILAVALAIAPVASAAPLDFTLAGTLDASHYAAGASAVAKIRLLSIDYQGGTYRFQLLDSSGAPYGGGAVYGVDIASPSEANAQADITASILAAH